MKCRFLYQITYYNTKAKYNFIYQYSITDNIIKANIIYIKIKLLIKKLRNFKKD